MGKLITQGLLDGTLDQIATCVTFTLCAGEPANFAAIATNALASTTIGSGDFTKANGDVSGRKITVDAQADLEIDFSGDVDHVVIDNGTDFMVTTCATQALTAGGTVSTTAYAFESRDPT